MTDDEQHARQLPAHRPRRSPVAGLPRLAEADRPDPDELAHVRAQLAGRRRCHRAHTDRR